MSVITPWAMNALSGAPLYDAPTLRRLHGGLLLGGQSAMLPLPGCLDPRALQVDVSSDPLVTVSPGLAVVTTAEGPYVTGLDATWSASLAARHTSFARLDRVVLEIRDTALVRDAVVRVITGTPSASPALPVLPTTAIALGRIAVPNASGGPAAVTDERLFTAAQGGIIYVPDAAARLRLGSPATGNGYYVHEISTGILWRNAGSAWDQIHPDSRASARPYAMAAGVVQSTAGVPASGSAAMPITFPTGRFTVPPVVAVSTVNGRLTAAPNAVSATGFTASLNNWSPAAAASGVEIHWSAIQMTATTAAG